MEGKGPFGGRGGGGREGATINLYGGSFSRWGLRIQTLVVNFVELFSRHSVKNRRLSVCVSVTFLKICHNF